jgi:hypothetical protein
MWIWTFVHNAEACGWSHDDEHGHKGGLRGRKQGWRNILDVFD